MSAALAACLVLVRRAPPARPLMAAVESGPKRRNNYKLLVDPELKKGAKKVYRLNGKDVPGVGFGAL